MASISAGVGLFSGFPIQSTVDQLIAISAQPRDALQTQVNNLTSQQNALTTLSTALIKLQLTTLQLNNSNTFDQRTATSSNPAALAVTTSGFPSVANYQFTPLQLAQSQQLLSSGFTSNNTALGAGTLTLGYGGAVDTGESLANLNGGAGVDAGSIRITDRSGASAVIDLSTARTVVDVLNAVNSNPDINVQLSVEGGHFVLTDKSGQTTSNLKVQNVGGDTTAGDLGLASINSASDSAQGTNVVSLGNSTLLSSLNDGSGVSFDPTGPDLEVNFHDGSSPLSINFTSPAVAGTKATATTSAAAGVNGQLVFTAKTAGSAYAGVQIRFVNDPSVQEGSETAIYSSSQNTLTFSIDQGKTTASDIIAALSRSITGSAAFSVALAPGSNGSGLISTTDSAVTGGPSATATTPGVDGVNSQIQFTAVNQGDSYDGVAINFVDDSSVTEGAETVDYNATSKQLTFHIDAGHTTANDILNALSSSPTVNKLFQAQLAPGSNGTGLVEAGDDVTTSGGAIVEPQAAQTPTSVGDLLNVINAADPARLKAQISSDGQSIQLIDLTSGSNPFSVADVNDSQVAADLGLATSTSSNSDTGRQVLSGLKTVLLSDLNGGQGLGTLGTLSITDRSGATANVDLSSAKTLDDVIADINGAGIGVQASVNSAHNGISIDDTTGQTASNLIIADGDSSQTAEALGIATNSATNSVNSGSLHLQSVSDATLLSSLNGGGGVALGSFKVFNSAGASGTVDLSQGNVNTVGDAIAAINALNIGVDAQINSTGDGIELVDTLGGSAKLSVQDISSTTAADLHLTGAATSQTVAGQPQQVINGSQTYTINISSSDTLDSLVQKINNLGGGFSAAELNSGGGATPYQLSITSQNSGAAGNLVFDTSQAPFSLQESIHGTDALLQVGGASGGAISSSSSNTFNNLYPGLNVQLLSTSASPVSVSVSSSGSSAATAIQAMVDAYNQVQSLIQTDTAFTPPATSTDTATSGPLFGDSSVLQVQTDLGNLVSSQFFGAGSIQSLAGVGITVNGDGTLTFDSDAFNTALANNPQGVEDFFTTAQTGFSAQLKSSIDRLAAGSNALLLNHLTAINTTITNDNNEIANWNTRLNDEQNNLLNSFYRMETAIAAMQNQMQIVNQIQGFGIFSGGGSSSSSNSSSAASTASSALNNLSSGLTTSGSSSGSTSSSGSSSSGTSS